MNCAACSSSPESCASCGETAAAEPESPKSKAPVNLVAAGEIRSKNFTSTRNACKLCTPLGACLVFRGVEGCIPFLHGSQGCSTYIRRYLISHFNEPIDIASSSFGEDATVFGGGAPDRSGHARILFHPRSGNVQ